MLYNTGNSGEPLGNPGHISMVSEVQLPIQRAINLSNNVADFLNRKSKLHNLPCCTQHQSPALWLLFPSCFEILHTHHIQRLQPLHFPKPSLLADNFQRYLAVRVHLLDFNNYIPCYNLLQSFSINTFYCHDSVATKLSINILIKIQFFPCFGSDCR